MRVIIAGSRGFDNYELLKKECDSLLKNFINIEIASGGAFGADKLGERYAKEKGFPLKIFPADWDNLGKKAGYLRNGEMAKYAKSNNGLLIAFWDSVSKGTFHMINIAKKLNLCTIIIKYKDEDTRD